MRARHDGNTSRGMRARDIYRGLLERVGGEADVLAAAELKVACEDLRGKMLAGEAVDSNHLVRIRRLKKIASGTGAHRGRGPFPVLQFDGARRAPTSEI
jgi:hypothetical protein